MSLLKKGLNNIKVNNTESTVIDTDVDFYTTLLVTKQNRAKKVHDAGVISNVGTVINISESWANIVALLKSQDIEKREKGKSIFKYALYKVAKKPNINVKLNNNKGVKYHGLQYFKCNVGDITLLKCVVNDEIQKAVLESIANVDLDDINNLIKIAQDINVICRMYGEGTIDFAKTLKEILGLFIQEDIKNASTLRLKNNAEFINFDNLLDDNYQWDIEYKGKYQLDDNMEVGDSMLFENNGNTKLIYMDYINKVRILNKQSLQYYVNSYIKDNYKNVKIMTECTFSYGDIKDVRNIVVVPFAALYSWKIESLKQLDDEKLSIDDDKYYQTRNDIFETIETECENIAENYHVYVKECGLSNAEAGELLYMACSFKSSNDKKELVVAPHQSAAYKQIAKEYFLAYCLSKSDDKYAYAELIGDKSTINSYENGEIIELKDGYIYGSDLTVYTESEYNGYGEIYRENDSNKTFVRVNVEDMINTKIRDAKDNSEQFMLNIGANSFVDISKLQGGVFELTNNSSIFNELINREDVIFRLAPVANFRLNGKPHQRRNVLYAIFSGKTLPIAIYQCSSNRLQSVYAGVSFKPSDAYFQESKYGIRINYVQCNKVNVPDNMLYDYNISNGSKKVSLDAFDVNYGNSDDEEITVATILNNSNDDPFATDSAETTSSTVTENYVDASEFDDPDFLDF